MRTAAATSPAVLVLARRGDTRPHPREKASGTCDDGTGRAADSTDTLTSGKTVFRSKCGQSTCQFGELSIVTPVVDPGPRPKDTDV